MARVVEDSPASSTACRARNTEGQQRRRHHPAGRAAAIRRTTPAKQLKWPCPPAPRSVPSAVSKAAILSPVVWKVLPPGLRPPASVAALHPRRRRQHHFRTQVEMVLQRPLQLQEANLNGPTTLVPASTQPQPLPKPGPPRAKSSAPPGASAAASRGESEVR